jgi:hypothetical protein
MLDGFLSLSPGDAVAADFEDKLNNLMCESEDFHRYEAEVNAFWTALGECEKKYDFLEIEVIGSVT